MFNCGGAYWKPWHSNSAASQHVAGYVQLGQGGLMIVSCGSLGVVVLQEETERTQRSSTDLHGLAPASPKILLANEYRATAQPAALPAPGKQFSLLCGSSEKLSIQIYLTLT